jgi:DNA-binding Lrp family transcriptional regulator
LTERLRIDETDAKILHQLLKESRTSFTELSKICNITVGAVRMRYKKLWRTGVINGEIMQVNPQSLSYKFICDINILTSAENESNVLTFLASKPYIQYTIKTYGKYNITTKVTLTNMQELAAILVDLETNDSIKQVDTMIWAEVSNTDYPENLLIKFNNGTETLQSNNLQHNRAVSNLPVEMDALDRKIAKIISQHSRTTFRKIAEQTGISTKNVIQRYKRLRGNVLTLSAVTVNLKKLGYNAHATIFVKVVNKSKVQEIQNQLVSMPNILNVTRLIGPYDLEVILTLQEFEELFKFKEQMRKNDNIENTEIYIGPALQSYPLNIFQSLL